MTQRGLSASSWYNDLLKASHVDHPPYVKRRKRQPKTSAPMSDMKRMEAINNVVAMFNRGWVSPANAVKVIQDIVR